MKQDSSLRAANDLVVLLSACSYPHIESMEWREEDLVENCRWIRETFPTAKIIVVDSGVFRPKQIEDVEVLHNGENYSKDPSVGEVRNLIEGLALVPPGSRVMKLHARCKLSNYRDLATLLEQVPEFVLLNRNIWARSTVSYDLLPYIDTRIFCLRKDRLSKILQNTLNMLETNGGRFERAFLASVLGDPDDCEVVKVSGRFYPVLSGPAGHGRNYSSIPSVVRSKLKNWIYRFGL